MAITWHIREATRQDSSDLQRCMESAYAAYQERMGGKRLPPMDVDYGWEIEHYPTWVAETAGDIIGGLIMVFDNGTASIANIAVAPSAQGQGVGGGLIKFAESIAKKRGFAELQLTTHVLLKENISLYRHLGWQEAGRDEFKVFMKKTI